MLSMVKHRGKFYLHGQVCGSHGACLDSMLPGVQVTAGLGFFLRSGCLGDSKDSDSLLQEGLVPL